MGASDISYRHCSVPQSPVLPPAQLGTPSYFPLVVLCPASHWNLMFFSTGWGPRLRDETGSLQRRLWGLEQSFGFFLSQLSSAQWDGSIAPLQGGVSTALWDCAMLQGRDCTKTRDRHVFVTSPLQAVTFTNCLSGNKTALLNICIYEHQHITCSFFLCLFRDSLSGSKCL